MSTTILDMSRGAVLDMPRLLALEMSRLTVVDTPRSPGGDAYEVVSSSCGTANGSTHYK